MWRTTDTNIVHARAVREPATGDVVGTLSDTIGDTIETVERDTAVVTLTERGGRQGQGADGGGAGRRGRGLARRDPGRRLRRLRVRARLRPRRGRRATPSSSSTASRVVVDPASAPYLKGATVDFVESLQESGFKIENPNASGSCGCGHSFQVARTRAETPAAAALRLQPLARARTASTTCAEQTGVGWRLRVAVVGSGPGRASTPPARCWRPTRRSRST